MRQVDPAASAVVVDRFPLLRIGMRKAVDEAGFAIAGEAGDLAEGIGLARATRAGLLVVGEIEGCPLGVVRRAADAAVVVGLVGAAGRDDLVELFSAGLAGAALRSSGPAEVADVLTRVARGERALAPALVPALAGMGPSAVDGAAAVG